MNVLVIGGTGFIGGHLCEELAAAGHDVYVQDVSLGCWPFINSNPKIKHLLLCSYGEASKSMQYVIDYGIEAVYVLAGVSHTVQGATSADLGYQAGVYGLVRWLNEMRRWDSSTVLVERVLVASSSLISGILATNEAGDVESNEPWVNTKDSYHPYVSNKIAMEMALWDHRVLTDGRVDVTPMRFGTAYGPRMRPGVVEHYYVMGALSEDKTIWVDGDGSQWRQCLYVKDIVKGQVAALEKARNRIVYLVPRWRTSVKDMALTMQRIDPEVKIKHRERRPIDIRLNYIDPYGTESLLDWKAEASFLDGMKETYAWFKKHPEYLR